MNRIKELRLANKIKLIDLASELKITKNTLSSCEKDLCEPGEVSINKIVKKFNVSKDYLDGITEKDKYIFKDESEKIPNDILKLANRIMSLNPDKRKSIIDNLDSLLSKQNL